MDTNDQHYSMMNRETFEAAIAALSRTKIAIKESSHEQNLFSLIRDTQMYPGNQGQDLENLNACLVESGTKLTNHLSNILRELSFAMDLCSSIIKNLEDVLKQHLAAWRERQKLAGNGYTGFDPGYLNILQKECEEPVEMARTILQLIKHTYNLLQILTNCYGRPGYIEQIRFLDKLSSNFTTSLRSLINTTFVIKIQPPQVIKKGTKFSAEICSLVVANLLEKSGLPLQVDIQATIINEKQANFFVSSGKVSSSTCGELIFDKEEKMRYYNESKEFIAKLKNMTLNKVQRSVKKGSDSVVDEKFAMIFSATFTLIGNINVLAETMSLPLTVVVHGSQEPRAMATILWDNGCSQSIRSPFSTPDVVHWKQLAENLSMKCNSVTGKPLSLNDMNHMAQKLIECNFMNSSMKLSWSKFCKENLPKRNFTFWDWFYNILKMIKENLKDLWTDSTCRSRLIDGFISRKQAEMNLLECSAGTFLLRFSDSVLGGISIASVAIDQSGQKLVRMLSPYTSNDLASRPLANIISDATNLTYLYPDILKEEAFRKHYVITRDSLSSSPDDPYVMKRYQDSFLGISANPFSLPGSNVSSSSNSPTYFAYQTHSPNNVVPVSNDHPAFNDPDATIFQML